MARFRRRKQDAATDAADEPQTPDPADIDDELDDTVPGDSGPDESGPDDSGTVEESVVLTRPQGPWDAADAPPADGQRIDLGALLVPVPPDTEVRVDVGVEGEVLAATLVQDGASMQVSAFAAPRSQGTWTEIAQEITDTLVAGGGQVERTRGPYGVELQARVPTAVAGQGTVLVPARFLGVDGPRWFLRALLTGTAAVDEQAAAPLLSALRDVVVVRGNDPMAVRDPLPLRLPRDVLQEPTAGLPGVDGDDDDDDPDAPRLDTLPERGPEITETR